MTAIGLRASFNENAITELGPRCPDTKASLFASWDMLMDRSADKDLSARETLTHSEV